MGLFDKVTQTAGSVGKGILTSTAKVGSTATTAAQEQAELISLRSQVNVINQELDSSYLQIGRKYVDFVLETGEMPGIDASDILKLIDPKLSKKKELEEEIIKLEKEIKNKAVLKEKQQVEAVYLEEKNKLDKALAMEVISQSDYDARLAVAKKKVDNFEEIRKVNQQYDMKLISKEERDEMIKTLTE